MEAAYVDDTLYTYLAPSGSGGGEPMRVEPDFAYFAPETATHDEGRLLYARFPADVTPEVWAASWPTNREASDYRLHRRDGATVVRYERSYRGADGQSFLVMPYQDVGMAIARAAREAYTSDPEESFLERPDLDLDALRSAAVSREVGWLHPIPDATGRKRPIWGVSVNRMCRAASFDPRSGDESMAARRAMLESMIDGWDGAERDGAASGDLLPPSGGRARADFFGVAWFPDDVGESGPVPPPEPESEAVGTTFQHGGRDWTVVRAWEPFDDRRGWMYEVVADDDFVAGMTQAGYEHHVLEASMGDVVPWRRDGVTYAEVAGLVAVAFTDAHRRLHFEEVRGDHAPGEVVQLFELRRDGEWVVDYECREVGGSLRYVPVEKMPYSTWGEIESIQTILQSEQDRLGEEAAAILEGVDEGGGDPDPEENDPDDEPDDRASGDDWGGGPLADLAAAALETDGGDEGSSPTPSTRSTPSSDEDDDELQPEIWEHLEDL